MRVLSGPLGVALVLVLVAANGCAPQVGEEQEEETVGEAKAALSTARVEDGSVALDGWWRDYAGSPWTGTASAGMSGGHSAVEVTNPPQVGTSLNGHATCDADGVNERVTADGVLADYMTEDGFSGWVLFKARSASPRQPVEPYLEPAFFGDVSGSVGVVFSEAGFGLHRHTDFFGWKQVHVTTPPGEWHVGTFRWNAAVRKLDVGLDGPPTHSVYCLPLEISVGDPSRVVHMFENFNGTRFLDVIQAETAITKQVLPDDTFRAAVHHVNDRYGLALSQQPNVKSGRYPGCGDLDAPLPTYLGSTITSSASYPERDGAKLNYFNGKYWLLGGWSPGSQPGWDGLLTTNEVWSSTDLITWTLELAHVSDPPKSGTNARWRPRHTFGSVVFDGYLWVVGSDLFDRTRADVWRSRDGRTWELVFEDGPWGHKRLPIVGVYAGAIHVLGGDIDEPPQPGLATRQHYRSTDGKTWEQLPDMPFARSGVYKAIEHCGLLLVIGGNSGNSTSERVLQNDTWAWDGSVWRQQSTTAPWSPRMWIDVVEYDKKIWALAGRSGLTESQDEGGAWYSTNAGRSWTAVQAPWPATHADGVVATEADGIVMASGNRIIGNVYRLKVAPVTPVTTVEP